MQGMYRSRGVCLTGILVLVAGFSREASASPPLRCETVEFHVALEPSGAADQVVVADVCARGTLQGKTIQVLVHGGASNHLYWDFPFQPDAYSYVRAITAAGYAVVNLDRLGDGDSSRPVPGIALTLHTAAFTVHQIVQELRAGGRVVPGFGVLNPERVMLVGHSLGSLIATIEAAQYDDVDAIILSGSAHLPGGEYPIVNASLYPAAFDPLFAALGLPFDYLTIIPGMLIEIFFEPSNADPVAVAVAEANKDTVTVGELADIPNAVLAAADLSPDVPTLVVVGDLDFVVCPFPSCTANDIENAEREFFPPDQCLDIDVVPGGGHYLNLELTAQDWFAIAADWSDRRVGSSDKTPASEPCP